MIKKYAIWILLIALGVTVVRESGIISLDHYHSERRKTSQSNPLILNRFKDVGEIIVINEYGDSHSISISDSSHKVRLTVIDRFSDWDAFHIMPLYKSTETSHRIYYSIENTRNESRSWNKWADVFFLQANITDTTKGFVSTRNYRTDLIKDASRVNSNFAFLRKN